jgi:hypothetical protein
MFYQCKTKRNNNKQCHIIVKTRISWYKYYLYFAQIALYNNNVICLNWTLQIQYVQSFNWVYNNIVICLNWTLTIQYVQSFNWVYIFWSWYHQNLILFVLFVLLHIANHDKQKRRILKIVLYRQCYFSWSSWPISQFFFSSFWSMEN